MITTQRPGLLPLSFAAIVALAGSPTAAQPCDPAWDVAVGNPGITSGYAAALIDWNDGAGAQLYAGGSFDGISGVSGTRLIARWDRDGGSGWSSVGGGLSTGFTNGFVTSLLPFNAGSGEELVVGGFFASAGGVAGTKSLAKWSGTSWSALGSDFEPTSASAVWSLAAWDGVAGHRLYIGGSFPNVGEIVANGIAAWDGTTWASLGSGIAGSFSPSVFKLAVFDDGGGENLYAGGRFDSMDGVAAPLLARWTGSAWSRVGTNLASSSILADIEAMAVFDDGNGPALYVGGASLTVSGQSASVARWNGSTWTRVGQNVGGRVTSLAVFDAGDGPALYLGGTATPGISYFARLENNQWVAAAGGVGGTGVPPSQFPSVFGLHVWDDAIYIGGNFTLAGGQSTAGLATLVACTSSCSGDLDADGLVGLRDLVILLANFGTESGAGEEDGDSDGDSDVDLNDLTAFLAVFGSNCP